MARRNCGYAYIEATTLTREVKKATEQVTLTLDGSEGSKCVWIALPEECSHQVADILVEGESYLDMFRTATVGSYSVLYYRSPATLAGGFTFVMEK